MRYLMTCGCCCWVAKSLNFCCFLFFFLLRLESDAVSVDSFHTYLVDEDGFRSCELGGDGQLLTWSTSLNGQETDHRLIAEILPRDFRLRWNFFVVGKFKADAEFHLKRYTLRSFIFISFDVSSFQFVARLLFQSQRCGDHVIERIVMITWWARKCTADFALIAISVERMGRTVGGGKGGGTDTDVF